MPPCERIHAGQILREASRISPDRESASLALEQELLDEFLAWAGPEHERRRRRADQARERALRANDEATWQHAEIVEQSYAQLDDMLHGGEPYFARVRGRLRDAGGDLFLLDVRVHKYARSEAFVHRGDEMLAISHLTALADLVRNPAERRVRLTLSETDLMRWPELRDGFLEVLEADVEDVELEGGRVVRVAPRYGAVFEDRVKRRLQESARPGLDILADVLDRRQNEAINDRDPRFRLTVLDGPAGTGKTVVAAHRVAVLAPPGSPGIYLTPSATLRDYVGPALPRLGLERSRVRVVSLPDLARLFWPALDDVSWAGGRFLVSLGRLEGAVREEMRASEEVRLAPLLAAVDQAVRLADAAHPEPGTRAGVALGWIRRWRTEGRYDHPETLVEQYATLREALPALPRLPAVSPSRGPAVESLFRRSMRRLKLPVGLHPVGLVMLAAILERPWPGERPAWVIVDEAQAFPPGLYEALGRLVDPTAPVVLAGDLMQRGFEQGLSSWDEARAALQIRKGAVQTLWLGRNYRVPPHIHRVAERLRRALDPEAPESESVPWHPVPGEVRVSGLLPGERLQERVRHLIDRARTDGVSAIAVLAQDDQAASHLEEALQDRGPVTRLDGRAPYRGGLTVGTMETARGLEFDWVVLAGVAQTAYPGEAVGAERLYTAMTRARRAVHLVLESDEPASPWIARIVEREAAR